MTIFMPPDSSKKTLENDLWRMWAAGPSARALGAGVQVITSNCYRLLETEPVGRKLRYAAY